MQSERNYGIDLLRLVLMFMVCMLHILGQGGVLTASSKGSAAYYIFWFLEACCFCAVNGFALISGYISSGKSSGWHKLPNMWFQAFFYSFVLTVILRLANVGAAIGAKGYLALLLPVMSNRFWYFTAYFALVFAMPVLDKFIHSIDVPTARKVMIIIILLFSVIGLIADPFNTKYGYSALWLMVMYCMGALAKKTDLFAKKSNGFLIALFLVLNAISCLVKVFFDIGRISNYISPTMVINGLILVTLFSRIKIRGKLIAKISPLAFGIYLFQLSPVIWNNILKDRTAFIASKPVYIGICLAFLCAAALFLAGLAVEFLRSSLAKLIRIPALSRKIAGGAEKMIVKLTALLK